MAFTARHTQRGIRRLVFRVDGTGTAAITAGGRHATLVDNGTGDYTLTFARASARTPIMSGAPCVENSAGGTAAVHTINTTSVRILTFSTGTTAADRVFSFEIQLFDTPTES